MRGMLLMAAAGLMLARGAAAQTQYSVYCAGGRIEVDSRDPEQMRVARGSGVCQFGSFSTRSSAEDLARRQFNGIGASCTCGR